MILTCHTETPGPAVRTYSSCGASARTAASADSSALRPGQPSWWTTFTDPLCTSPSLTVSEMHYNYPPAVDILYRWKKALKIKVKMWKENRFIWFIQDCHKDFPGGFQDISRTKSRVYRTYSPNEYSVKSHMFHVPI